MKKPALVHMLPTDKASNLYLYDNILIYSSDYTMAKHASKFPQHIYFTTDEEIKYEDCCINLLSKEIEKASKNLVTNWRADMAFDEDFLHPEKSKPKYIRDYYKKIVATTNSELWVKKEFDAPDPINPKAKVQGWAGLPKIDQSFVIAYISAYNAGTPIKEVMLEYEEYNARPDLGDFLYKGNGEYGLLIMERLKLNSDGSVIWSLKEKKMYTYATLLGVATRAFHHRIDALPWDTVSWDEWKREWFDENYPA